ncbi:MAG: glycerophosphodiester phosphodiesterase [Balneolaceae bacterium]|nr:glycerophosphodiester phosphodiesterase [Balneolaceae bacterium]
MEAISSPIKLYSDNTDGFVVIGHRGASAYYPENTMTAFKAALEMGAEMIELDILLSKDGVPVVIHDETLNRTTNSQGLVNEYTADELQAMDAGSWFAPAFAGEPIPTLEDVLAFAKGKIAVNIEIKTEAVTDVVGGGIEQKSLELVKQFGMEEYVLFSSFDYRAIAHLRELDDDVATALLYEKKQSGNKTPVQLVSEYKANAFNCSYRQFNKKRASKLRAHNIPVFVYTVNKEKRMRKLIKKGVTGIFSDKPDLLSRLVDNMWENN